MLDEVVIRQGDPLHLQRDIEERAAAGDRQHIVGNLLDDAGPRVVILVDAVTESHQPEFAGPHPFDVLGNPADRPDLLEHAQHLLVGASVKRTIERGRGGGRRRERIGMCAAHGPHHVRRTILLVVGVQDQEHVERTLQHRVWLVFQFRRFPHHVEEVARVRKIVVRIGERHAHRVAIGERGQGRHFCDQPQDLKPAAFRF